MWNDTNNSSTQIAWNCSKHTTTILSNTTCNQVTARWMEHLDCRFINVNNHKTLNPISLEDHFSFRVLNDWLIRVVGYIRETTAWHRILLANDPNYFICLNSIKKSLQLFSVIVNQQIRFLKNSHQFFERYFTNLNSVAQAYWWEFRNG
jgi:hypothetical protein